MNYAKILLLSCIYLLSVQNNAMQLISLHQAAMSGDACRVQALIDRKENINAQDDCGSTPLHCAVLGGGHVVIIEMLLKAGASPDLKDRTQKTPLLSSAWLRREKAVQTLLSGHANPNVQETYGWTPLHFACQQGYVAIVKMLLDAHAEAEIKDAFDSTPLHEVVYNYRLEPTIMLAIIKLLLSHGAQVNVRDNENWTPFYLAVRLGKKYEPVRQFLKNAGAEDKRPNPQQKIEPLAAIVSRGHHSEVLFPCPY